MSRFTSFHALRFRVSIWVQHSKGAYRSYIHRACSLKLFSDLSDGCLTTKLRANHAQDFTCATTHELIVAGSLPHSRPELGLEATLNVQDLADLATIDVYPVHGLWQQNLVRPDSAGPTLPPHPVAVAA